MNSSAKKYRQNLSKNNNLSVSTFLFGGGPGQELVEDVEGPLLFGLSYGT
jgi:hypothetical protein